MKKLFSYLATLVYPFLISVYIFMYADIVYNSGEEILIALTIIFGILALVGIVGNIVVLSIDAHKERKSIKPAKTDAGKE